MALAEAAKGSDRPTLALLTEEEDLLVRAGQLAPRCGLTSAMGAILPIKPVGVRDGPAFISGSLISGPRQGFEKLFEVLAASGDPREAELARSGDLALADWKSPLIACSGRILQPGSLDRGERPLVMGILNVTPDSFSDGGAYLDPEAAVARGLEMEAEGADLIDVGGESTRPGSEPVSLEVESSRVLPVIEKLAGRLRVPISIDTTKAEVARRALESGASLINDVSGLGLDGLMPQLAAAAKVPVVIGHMRGRPKTMQEEPHYLHPVLEVLVDLALKVRVARDAGVGASHLLVDPGIGFGKRLEDNLALLRHLRILRALRCPVLAGLSRKSFLGVLTGSKVTDRLPATLAAEVLAAAAGADILRTHEPGALLDALKVASGISGSFVSH